MTYEGKDTAGRPVRTSPTPRRSRTVPC